MGKNWNVVKKMIQIKMKSYIDGGILLKQYVNHGAHMTIYIRKIDDDIIKSGDEIMSKKITRIMKVSMDEKEFEKLDKGEIHSDKGLRNKSGQYSVFPDISPIEEKDLPTKEIVKTETVYIEVPQQNSNDYGSSVLKQLTANLIYDLLSDSEIREYLGNWAPKIWKNKIVPKYRDIVDFFRSIKSTPKAVQILEEHKNHDVIIDDNLDNKIVVTEEQAKQLILVAKKKARELSSMIYILTNLVIKEEKTDEEYRLEQSYIENLLSDESTSTMKALIDNRVLVDDETASCFANWLNGYMVYDGDYIPIPRIDNKK